MSIAPDPEPPELELLGLGDDGAADDAVGELAAGEEKPAGADEVAAGAMEDTPVGVHDAHGVLG